MKTTYRHFNRWPRPSLARRPWAYALALRVLSPFSEGRVAGADAFASLPAVALGPLSTRLCLGADCPSCPESAWASTSSTLASFTRRHHGSRRLALLGALERFRLWPHRPRRSFSR